MFRSFFSVMVLALLCGCASSVERDPLPLALIGDAEIPGIDQARYWADALPEDFDTFANELVGQWAEHGTGHNRSLLALSGGAEDGAFTAGLMRGWTETGERPEFTIVTGVSTGALAAPFVFVGPEYDDELVSVYGDYPPHEIYKPRLVFNIASKASVADTGPLLALIRKFITDDFLREVAREHQRGRRLFVQTVNLEAQRPVVWNMGAIAASGVPHARELFIKALLASASIPVAFPPVLFDVEADGKRYDEIHADGGVISQTIVLGAWQDALRERLVEADMEGGIPTFYLVRNGRVSPLTQRVEYDLLEVGSRSILTLIYGQGVANLIAAYEAAQIRGGKYFATWIGSDFPRISPEPFDQSYMRALSQYGYELMKSGKAWRTTPPFFQDVETSNSALPGGS